MAFEKETRKSRGPAKGGSRGGAGKGPPRKPSSSRDGASGDRPKRSFSRDGAPPKRDFGDRPKRDFGDRPPRKDFGDRPPRREGSSEDRPKRSYSRDGAPPKRDFGDRPKRDFGDRPPRKDFGDRPPRREGASDERPRRSYDDKPRAPRGDFGDRPKRDFGDRPKRDFGDRPPRREGASDERPRRSYDDKPRAPRGDFGDRPKRDFGDKPRAPRRDFTDSPRDSAREDRPPRRDYSRASDTPRAPRKDFGDRPPRREGGSEDRPRRAYSEDRPPRKDFGDRPPRREGFEKRESKFADKGGEKAEPIKGHELLFYGVHAVHAALKNKDRKVVQIWVTDSGQERLGEAWDKDRHPEPELIERRDLDRRLSAGAVHQGMAIAVEPLQDVFLTDIMGAANAPHAKRHIIVVLDEVTDPHNIGAVLRSMSAFGAKAMIVHKRNAPGITGVMAKIATGAVETVPMVAVTNLASAMEELKAAGFFMLGLDENADYPIQKAPTDGHIALVLGAEGEGLRAKTRSTCDAIASIETFGDIKSLNVSNAAAIGLFALTQK